MQTDTKYSNGKIDKWQFWQVIFDLYTARKCTQKEIAAWTYANPQLVKMRMADFRNMS